MRNQDVIRSFAWGKRAATGNLHTDGRSLWSYDLKIAQRTPEGVVVGDFTAPGGRLPLDHHQQARRHGYITKRTRSCSPNSSPISILICPSEEVSRWVNLFPFADTAQKKKQKQPHKRNSMRSARSWTHGSNTWAEPERANHGPSRPATRSRDILMT